jgi:hypothetical protein
MSFDHRQIKCQRLFDMVSVAYRLHKDFFGFLSASKKFEADTSRTRKPPSPKALANALLQRGERDRRVLTQFPARHESHLRTES